MLFSTNNSLYNIAPNKSSTPQKLLTDLDIRRITRAENKYIVALSEGSIIINHKEKDKIQETEINERIDSLLIIKNDPLELLIGCTPPNLYRFIEDEGPAKPVSSFQELSARNQWYTPWGGPPAVRSLAKTSDDWVYADIHVGSIMRSPDNGENWEPVKPDLHKDVHQVITSPTYNERVYANTYLSVYVSEDRGETWHHRSNSLNERYGRGIAVHPTEPDLLMCGVSDGPSGRNVNGQLYRSTDAGRNWIQIKEGFPESTMKNIDTFHINLRKTMCGSQMKHIYI